MNLFDYLNRILSPNDIYRQLYPASSIRFSFRNYQSKDREAVLAIYDSNAPERFPVGHRPHFEEFLNDCDNKYFIAESPEHGVIASGGAYATGERTHTLCYGMVAPQFHGNGIGSALTLARLIFGTRGAGPHFSFIYALNESLSFYNRFGFSKVGKWTDENGKEHPLAVIGYEANVLAPIKKVLDKRNHLLDNTLPLAEHPEMETVVTAGKQGTFDIQIKPRSPTRR